MIRVAKGKVQCYRTRFVVKFKNVPLLVRNTHLGDELSEV